MSRFDGSEWDGEGTPPEFWEQAVKNALRGRKGQAILRELREAMLALPQPRLIKGSVVHEGEVCAIGALVAHRMSAVPSMFNYEGVKSLREFEERFGENLGDEWGTVELGMDMGLTRALAWAIAYENDEGTWKKETPEERFQRVLAWIDRELVSPAATNDRPLTRA